MPIPNPRPVKNRTPVEIIESGLKEAIKHTDKPEGLELTIALAKEKNRYEQEKQPTKTTKDNNNGNIK